MEKEMCLRCGYSWVKRVDAPVVCPECRSPYWDKPKVRETKKKYGLS